MLRPASRLLLALLLALAVAACGEDDEPAAPAATPTPQAAAVDPATGCERAQAPPARPSGELSRPRAELDPAREYVLRVLTSCGEFQITLDAERAPRTGGAFLSLVRRGFFDNTTFHRVATGFVVQGGDPEGTGTGGPGYSVRERPPAGLTYAKGIVAMAKTADEPAGTSGSQFFVVVEDAELPPDYALLGRVTQGMDVVERIAAVPVQTPGDGPPVDPVVVRQISLQPS